MEGEESAGFLKHNLRWCKLTYVGLTYACCCRAAGTFLKSILNHWRMVNWVRTLTQSQWRVYAGTCLDLHEPHDRRPQFPGNDCAFSSLLESYLLSPSTWDGHVKHGLRPLRFRSAARAARQLTHIKANKYEAWGNWLSLGAGRLEVSAQLATGSQRAHHVQVSVALDCDEHAITNWDMILGVMNHWACSTSSQQPPQPNSKYSHTHTPKAHGATDP